MVLAFIKAEVDSPRFGTPYQQGFEQVSSRGITRHMLIDNPDLASTQQNGWRIGFLRAVRGYRANTLLFPGFPEIVSWRRVGLEPADFSRLKYANHPTWAALSGGTRLVVNGARNVDRVVVEDANDNIRSVEAALRRGVRYPELIGVDGDGGDIILVEGHTRATAYVLAQLPDRVECIVGSSPAMNNWRFY